MRARRPTDDRTAFHAGDLLEGILARRNGVILVHSPAPVDRFLGVLRFRVNFDGRLWLDWAIGSDHGRALVATTSTTWLCPACAGSCNRLYVQGAFLACRDCHAARDEKLAELRGDPALVEKILRAEDPGPTEEEFTLAALALAAGTNG